MLLKPDQATTAFFPIITRAVGETEKVDVHAPLSHQSYDLVPALVAWKVTMEIVERERSNEDMDTVAYVLQPSVLCIVSGLGASLDKGQTSNARVLPI